MMRQYRRIKESCTDAILFFRLGDFYEMFQHDAKEASSILNLTLTQRNGIPMCGIPYHAAPSYISRLLTAGRKVAICEQVSPPAKGKGITRREIVEIITPGTVVDEKFLDQKSNNYILSLGRTETTVSASYIDTSTGEFVITAFPWEDRAGKLKELLYRIMPREMIIQESLLEEDRIISAIISEKENLLVNRFPDWSYEQEESRKKVEAQFQVTSLKGFGIQDNDTALFSCGVLLDYIRETAKMMLPHIRSVKRITESSCLILDESTQKNLELIRNLQDGSRKYSLLDILDNTKTALGARKLKQWILQPLIDIEAIRSRQERVELLYRNQLLLSSVRDRLSSVLDLERLAARVALDKAHAKDLLGIKTSLWGVLDLGDMLVESAFPDPFWVKENDTRREVTILATLIDSSISEDPSILLSEGNLIKDGYSSELDRLKERRKNSRQILDDYVKGEKEKSGITSLKIRYNRIIGYYLEVTKANIDKVPGHFIRRQSLLGSERYTTDQLVELETELNSLSETIINLEKKLFMAIRCEVKKSVGLLLKTAGHLARIDCIQSLAQAATIGGYTRPAVTGPPELRIHRGRHPVVEAHLPPGDFVPNSIHIGGSRPFFILLTGPNMAGKSTYLRQTALIILMAQMGSYIPAEEASIGIVDKIFCRVGATDNLARGESTFLVEMNETANILRNATENSLVIMDEVGRGTSTHDGLSIAWAVSEYLLDNTRAKTLFATHYHELTLLRNEALDNFSMEVKEHKGSIVFLKKVTPGPAGHSYGIHVAGLAGLPEEVLLRAEELLRQIEQVETREFLGTPERKERKPSQNELFSREEVLIKRIQSLDITKMTPLDALNLIAGWKKELEE